MERLALDRWASPWLRRQHLVRYQWASAFVQGARALDGACGTGYGDRILKQGGARQVDCVDYSREAFRAARRLGLGQGLNFVIADVTRLPLPGDFYDVVVSFETLEHVEDRGFLAEVRRVLKPGGRFLCSTPNRELLSPGRSLRDRPVNPFHLREYSREEFDSLLRSFFTSVALFGQTRFSSRHARLMRWAGRKSPRLARRLHQMRNLLGFFGETRERHLPLPLPLEGEPEVLIGVCVK